MSDCKPAQRQAQRYELSEEAFFGPRIQIDIDKFMALDGFLPGVPFCEKVLCKSRIYADISVTPHVARAHDFAPVSSRLGY